MPKKPEPTQWIVPGLTHRRAGDFLETVDTKVASVGLMTSSPDIEIIRIAIKEGKRLTVAPYDDPKEAGTEAYYVLEGTLEADATDEPMRLEPGDLIVASNLEHFVSFVALTPVVLLGMTARPTFHQVSTEMGDLMRMATAVEEKDGYTGEHCARLQKYSVAMGRRLGLRHDRMYLLEIGAYLHDLGKVKVPPEILGKKGPLTDDEWLVMRQHPTWGRELLEGTFLEMAGPILEQHHERLDGSGYPFGLKGEAILLESSVVAVADTYDAITTDRPYRKGATPAEAIVELRKFAVVHYPERVIDAMEAVLRDEGLLA